MEKTRSGMESANEWATERDAAARPAWTDVINVASRLSHLVQSGRHVSSEQLGEVSREVRQAGEFLKK
jgi:hypothetical protein